MDDYRAVMIVEGVENVESPVEYLQAVSYLIETGMAWSLQGFFGRTCARFIDEGIISKTGEILITEDEIYDLFEE